MNNTELASRSLKTIWYPASQMKDYENFLPRTVVKAKDSYLHLQDGTKIIDAISSWWCKHLGHAHPRLKKALIKQVQKLEHILLPNVTNEAIIELSERLTGLTASLKKVFYASDGSCAVEIALKMAVHAAQLKGQSHKNQILALSNSYHGETLFALAASDVGIYRQAYEAFLPQIDFIKDVPYVSSEQDANWHNCQASWDKIESQLKNNRANLLAIIVEPILQGAGGIHLYSKDFLYRLRKWCSENEVYLIADEIMTGFGRTGKMFACEHANIEPDFLCLGKALTGGMLPMSAVLTTDAIYDIFYHDYEAHHSFLHSHTYSGNVLAAAVATESIKIITEDAIIERSRLLQSSLLDAMQAVAEKTNRLTNIRGIGGVVAADLVSMGIPRFGYKVCQQAMQLGALLRPLGNTIYWLPPLNIKKNDIKKLRDITAKAILLV